MHLTELGPPQRVSIRPHIFASALLKAFAILAPYDITRVMLGHAGYGPESDGISDPLDRLMPAHDLNLQVYVKHYTRTKEISICAGAMQVSQSNSRRGCTFWVKKIEVITLFADGAQD